MGVVDGNGEGGGKRELNPHLPRPKTKRNSSISMLVGDMKVNNKGVT